MISLEAEERCCLGGESKVSDLNATLQPELPYLLGYSDTRASPRTQGGFQHTP